MKLGNILKFDKDNLIEIEDDKGYTIAGVQSYGQGVVNRRSSIGKNLNMKKYQVIKKNQLMWCKVDTKNGAFGVTTEEHIGSLASTNMALANIDVGKANPEFIQLLFRIPFFYENINSLSTGTTNRKYLKRDEVLELINIPDMNLEQQNRFLKWYKDFEAEYSKLTIENNMQSDMIKQLRQNILQEAVQGKLVPQDPNDEPANILVERIKEEKERLITEKKIKKEKPLPLIIEDEIPYELPEGWLWTRLGDLCELITKGSSPKWQGVNYIDNQNGVLFITSENVGNYRLILTNKKYLEWKFNEIEPRSILKKGDILMNIVGASIGRTAIFEVDDVANINQAVCTIRTIDISIYRPYLLYFLNSSVCINYMYDKQVDSARANLSMGNISKFLIPLPPLNEQKRIVEKVDRFMYLCDELEKNIQQSKNDSELLMQSVLKEAFKGKN